MNAKKIINTAAITILLLAGSAAAQTGTTSTSTSGGVTSPGTPNTGVGGNAAANVIALTASAAVALGGAAYLLRRGQKSA